MGLLSNRIYYKPFKYPWAYEAFIQQNQMHWVASEISFAEDKKDWDKKLTEDEKYLLTQIFRFFVQADIGVAEGYYEKFLPLFKHPELRMMMGSFAAMEGIHIDAYSMLLDTVNMPEVEYQAFHEYKEMQEKYDYLEGFNPNYANFIGLTKGESIKELAKTLAVYSAFTEGLQLFSSFAILLNFSRFGKMKSMGQVVTLSIRDETLHVNSMIRLFNTLIHENPEIWTNEFKKELYQICRDMVKLEDKFIHLAFKQGGIEGLTEDEVKKYVRWIANRRLLQLGLKTNYRVKENPLPWLEAMLNSVEHANFFENRVTEYTKASSTGSWEDVWNAGVIG